ncbi:MAG: hypothetical protein RRZ92_00145 [Bacilli bacterium]
MSKFFNSIKNYFLQLKGKIKILSGKTVVLLRVVESNCSSIWSQLLNKYSYLLLGILFIGIAIIIRMALVPFVSWDLYSFIFGWLRDFRSYGFSYLGNYGGDYPPAYMIILYLISLLEPGFNLIGYGRTPLAAPINQIFAIKFVSTIFDVIMAVAIFFIIKKVSKNNTLLAFIGFTIALFLPTSILITGFWGQVDSSYVSLCLVAIAFMLYKKNRLGFLFYGFALAFKLQAIFFLPVIGVLWLNKEVKLRYLVFTFAAMLLTFLPSYIAGGRFDFPFLKYVNLTKEYGDPNYNSGSIFAFLQDISANPDNTKNNNSIITYAGLFFGFSVILFTMFVIYKKNIKMTNRNFITISALFSILVPYVLPCMHERYFFFADLMILVYSVLNLKRFYLVILSQLATSITLNIYLFGIYPIPNLGGANTKISALLNLVIICFLVADLSKAEKKEEQIIEVQTLDIKEV